jgi:hypothetical protein
LLFFKTALSRNPIIRELNAIFKKNRYNSSGSGYGISIYEIMYYTSHSVERENDFINNFDILIIKQFIKGGLKGI